MTAFEIMEHLTRTKIHFSMTTVRDGALMFEVTVPGQRWEVEVFDDGHFELERFKSDGVNVIDAAHIEALISEYSDEE